MRAEARAAMYKRIMVLAIKEIRKEHGGRALAPGLECTCNWCSPEPNSIVHNALDDAGVSS